MVVVDELGFHQATSVAELLADRGCQVEIVTNGMVVGQDLGITLDLETWNVRAHAKGIRQATDLVPLGVAEQDGERRAGPSSCICSTTRPARTATGSATGWSARCTSSPTTPCGTTWRTPSSPSIGSATAWPLAGPTPR